MLIVSKSISLKNGCNKSSWMSAAPSLSSGVLFSSFEIKSAASFGTDLGMVNWHALISSKVSSCDLPLKGTCPTKN